MSNAASPVTLLFTDLANSAPLLQQPGDPRAQRLLRAHHKLLKNAVAAHGGQDARWLGDGLLAVFMSTADAMRCAVALQQAARRRAAGERLSIRVGLHVAEALRDETDYFGTPVLIARRLCSCAEGGQILCSGLVAGLLAGREACTFRDAGALELMGLAAPIAASEVLYRHDEPTALLTRPPFVGRAAELAKLTHALQEAGAGQGGLVLLAGEPGIGKTRLTEEFAESAAELGALVLAGRCYEGEWAPPYGPFAEAIAAYTRTAEPEQLRQDLGLGAPPIARLVAAVRERLPDIPDAVTLQPEEERFRVLDAVSQFLAATATRQPVVLIVDDLHWADKGSIGMLRHVARFAPRNRLLILGTYRDAEVDRAHPLSAALGALPRETRYEHLPLQGLDRVEVEELLEAIADQEVPDALVAAIRTETSGNPFFIREVLLHLVEEGKILRREGRWVSDLAIAEMAIPEGVKQVIGRRLARLSAATQNLLTVAAAFTGGFHLAIAGRIAGLDEAATLDAVDEALAAQVLQRGSDPESCDFVHALIRHTLYAALSPPRQLRLHRQIAETMEEVYGDPSTSLSRAESRGTRHDGLAEHAAEIADQYHRSAALLGAERGVHHALVAAERATAVYAYDQVATYLRMAQRLLLENDARRPRLLGRLAVAVARALSFEEALATAQDAATGIAAAEGEQAAADYLADAASALHIAGFARGAWSLAARGLSLIGDRHDKTWVRLMVLDIARREAEDPDHPGIVLDTPERREVANEARRLCISHFDITHFASDPGFDLPRSRADVLEQYGGNPGQLIAAAGEFRRALPLSESWALQAEREGRIVNAIGQWAGLAIAQTALGDLAAARLTYERSAALAARVASPIPAILLTAARYDLAIAVDEGWEDFVGERQDRFEERAIEYTRTLAAAVWVSIARLCARLERADQALLLLARILPALQRAPVWAPSYADIACNAAATLWLLERTDHAGTIESALQKVLAADFRCPMRDARLATGQLCALQGRYDEAVEWFAKARAVLDEQGARPLRAIVDYDEALMYARRGAAGDGERAAPLLEAALEQFRAIGMTGWIKRAEELRVAGVRGQVSGAGEANLEPDTRHPTPAFLFRKEGDYWSITFEGCAFRLKDAKGLHYLAYLLHHPGHEFHALDLMKQVSGVGGQVSGADNQKPGTRDQGPSLDRQAKAAYKRRLDDLRDALEEAECNNDLARAAKARAEMECIAQQLAAAVGLGGRDRPVGADAERARLTVTKGIKAALEKIRANHPQLARHFAASIKTGSFCSYTPDPQRPGSWAV